MTERKELENNIESIYFIPHSKGMLYMEETSTEYIYYVGLPGFTKNDLDIRMHVEEDFLTIFVKSEKNSIFVEKQDLRIVKTLDKVDTEQNITSEMSNGILTISIPRKNDTFKEMMQLLMST